MGIVQSAVEADTGASLTATLPAAPTVGNTLVLLANSDNLISTTGTWTTRFHYLADQDFYIWSRPAVAGDSKAFTVTPSSADYVSVIVLELAGVSGFDVAGAVASGVNVNTLTAATTSTTAAGDLVLVVHALHGGVVPATFSWTNGFASAAQAIQPVNAAAATSLVVAQKLQATAGAVGATAATWTLPGTSLTENIAAVQVAFKAAATGPATVAAPVATVNVTARPPVVTAGGSAKIVAPVVSVNVSANTPVVSAATTVQGGGAATLTFHAHAPTISAGATSAAAVAAATVQAHPPTVTAGRSAIVAAPVAALTVAAHPPTVTGGATINAPRAAFTLTAPAPTVNASAGATVMPPPATVSLAAHAPQVTAGATVNALTATVSAAAHPPTVAAFTVITAPVARMTVTAPAPMVLAYRAATIPAPVATIRLTAVAPTVNTSGQVRDITVTATLDPPRWSASLDNQRWAGVLT